MRDRRRLIETGDANERGAKFKRAKKSGAKKCERHASPNSAPLGHFSAINLSARSKESDDATLPKLVPASLSATSSNRGELRAFPMNFSN